MICFWTGFLPGLSMPAVGGANLPPASMNSSMNATAPISSNNTNTTNNNNNSSNNNNMNSSIQSTGNGTTTPNLNVGAFRPKPIEELLMPQHDKPTKGTPPPPPQSQPPSSSSATSTPSSLPPQQMSMSEQKSNLASAFNKSMDPNLKNIARYEKWVQMSFEIDRHILIASMFVCYYSAHGHRWPQLVHRKVHRLRVSQNQRRPWTHSSNSKTEPKRKQIGRRCSNRLRWSSAVTKRPSKSANKSNRRNERRSIGKVERYHFDV